MQRHASSIVGALSLIAAGCLIAQAAQSEASASYSGPKIDINIVAESTRPDAVPTADRPVYYVLHDAGYVEKGDPLANDTPPAPATVTGALRKALAAAHYLPATRQNPPTLLLLSHWGTLRRDTMSIHTLQEIEPNLKARIGLVSTKAFADNIERELLDRKIYRLLRTPVRMLPNLSFAERDVLDLARDDRYFIVVSAFDYAAAVRREVVPVWRVKLSTRNVGASMTEAIAALVRIGKPWYGRNEAEPRQDRIALYPEGQVSIGEITVQDETSPAASSLDAAFFADFTRKERAVIAGERLEPDAAKPSERK